MWNSGVVHAVSKTVEGPYEPVGDWVVPPFAHEPVVAHARAAYARLRQSPAHSRNEREREREGDLHPSAHLLSERDARSRAPTGEIVLVAVAGALGNSTECICDARDQRSKPLKSNAPSLRFSNKITPRTVPRLSSHPYERERERERYDWGLLSQAAT